MAIKCLKCGYKMSTTQEITTFLSMLVVNTVKNLKEILQFFNLTGRSLGYMAGPLNVIKAKCPNCKSDEQWEDVPDKDDHKK